MLNNDVQETEQAFGRLKRISGGIRVFLIILAILVTVLLIVKTWAAVSGFFAGASDERALPDVFSIVFMVLTDIISVVCLLIGSNVFSALKKGDDPFSQRQVTIIRIAALLLIFDVLIGLFGSVGISWVTQFGQTSIGSAPSFGEVQIINVNIGELIIAGLLLGFSVVVDYARLLQKLSDETL